MKASAKLIKYSEPSQCLDEATVNMLAAYFADTILACLAASWRANSGAAAATAGDKSLQRARLEVL